MPNFGQFPHIERMFDTDSVEKKVNARQRGNIWMRGMGMVFHTNHWKGNNGRQYRGAPTERSGAVADCWREAQNKAPQNSLESRDAQAKSPPPNGSQAGYVLICAGGMPRTCDVASPPLTTGNTGKTCRSRR